METAGASDVPSDGILPGRRTVLQGAAVYSQGRLLASDSSW